MKIKLFYNKTIHENASYYYELVKETKEKIQGVEKAIKETQEEIEKMKAKLEKKEVRVKREKEWYEKYHFVILESGRLMIGGRNAQQNDQIVSKHMTESDLFFHADIRGGSVVILKEGTLAIEEELKEAAQIAACFSNAWKNANAAVDVYAVKKDQLAKKVSGGFVPAGAFAIIGERKWFRDTKLNLKIGKDENKVLLLPADSKKKLFSELTLFPSLAGKDKGSLAKSLAKRYEVHPDELLEILPNGKSKTSQLLKEH